MFIYLNIFGVFVSLLTDKQSVLGWKVAKVFWHSSI